MINDLIQFLILNRNETEIEKKLKKIIFIFISILFPLFEIIAMIYQIVDTFYHINFDDKNLFINGIFIRPIVSLCSFTSLICSWSMMSVCYNELKCINVILIVKTILIIIILLLSSPSTNFYYYLVFNVLGYGMYYTFIIIYKAFKKGII